MKKKNLYGNYDLETWLDDPEVKDGCNKNNLTYMRELRDISERFARNNYILFFMIDTLGFNSMRRMLMSGKSQRNFIEVVYQRLKIKQVTKEYIDIFERECKKLNDRVDYVFTIIKENIYLTEYYPYFESINWELLPDDKKVEFDQGEQLMYIKDDFEVFKSEHPEVIEKHMQDSASTRENHYKHRQDLKDAKDAEKKLEKEIRRRDKAEAKQTEKEIKAIRNQERLMELSYQHLYHDAEKYRLACEIAALGGK